MRRLLGIAAASGLLTIVQAPTCAQADILGLVPGYDDPQPAFSWQGQWQSKAVYFRSLRSGASLYGTVFAPAHPQAGSHYPLVIITPGSSVGVQAQYQWSARDLAGHGYVAFTVDPRGAGRSGEDAQNPCGPGLASSKCYQRNNANPPDYEDALRSAIAFALSTQDPYGQWIDSNEIGAAGHSEGADVLSYQQGIEPRLKAIVAWDNLISSTTGDQGNANCTNKPTTLESPRVPALGEASETCSGLVGPDAKKTGYELWRRHGIPAMEVVFSGTQHTDWAQEDNVPGTGTASGTEQQLHAFEYYTRAWFDLFLHHTSTAATTLLATTINARPREQVISSTDNSAAYLPAYGIDCQNLRQCRSPAKLIAATTTPTRHRLPVPRRGRTTLPITCRGNPGARCDGKLEILAPIGGRIRIIASAPLQLTAGNTAALRLQLTAIAIHTLHHRHRLPATVMIFAGLPPDLEHGRRHAITLIALSRNDTRPRNGGGRTRQSPSR